LTGLSAGVYVAKVELSKGKRVEGRFEIY